jgi:hypothetical protein
MTTLVLMLGARPSIARGVRRALAGARLDADTSFLFIQGLANSDKQFGDAHTVPKALALCQPPVVLPYRSLITVDECCPDEVPGSQLPPDCAQLVLSCCEKLNP